MIQSRHSRRIVPINLSQYAFAFGSADRSPQNPNRHALQRQVELGGKYGIPVANHKSVGMTKGKEFTELLNRPFSRWMGGDVEMENSS